MVLLVQMALVCIHLVMMELVQIFQKFAPAREKSTDISARSAAFRISVNDPPPWLGQNIKFCNNNKNEAPVNPKLQMFKSTEIMAKIGPSPPKSEIQTSNLETNRNPLKGGITPIAAFAFAPLLGYLGDKVAIISSAESGFSVLDV